jgi:transposase
MAGVMRDLVLQPWNEVDGADSEPSGLVPLPQEVVELRAQVAQLRRENLELRQQAGYWRSQHAAVKQRIAELERELAQLRGANRNLQDQLFGRKSETASPTDRSNDLDDPDDPPPSRPRGQRRGRPGPKRRDYSHLPVREELRELPESERVCPNCGRPLTDCGAEVSEQLEIETVVYRRVIRRRRYQRTCRCPGPRTVTAPAVPQLIPKGRLGVSLWVAILLDKFATQRPTERLLQSWQWLGLNLSAATVTDGLHRLEPLFSELYAALIARSRRAAFHQADETRWLVFVNKEGKVGYQWWLWVVGSRDVVVYILDPSRSHEVPEGHFPEKARGVLLVDRYSAYKAMAQVKSGGLVLAFCWAHVRRDFVRVGKGWPELKPWALAWLRRIRDLYAANRRRLHAPEDVAVDQEVRRLVEGMRQQCLAELADPTLQTPCRQALTSLQEHWEGLMRFVEDRRIPMDNNAMERRLRNPALGRKNYYGSGAEWSGRLATMLFSLLATLELWGLNPRLWLREYLEACAAAGGRVPADLNRFLPWNRPEAKHPEPQGAAPPHVLNSS